jgi:hypothetical protein
MQEDNNEEKSIIKEEGSVKEISRKEMIEGMLKHLQETCPEDKFVFNQLDDVKYDIIEVIANETIAFRQIIDMTFTLDENCMRIQGSYERNLRALEKLNKEYLEKHNQEVVYMDQAEAISIRTIKIEKEN